MEKKNFTAIVGGCVVGAIALGVLWMLASAIGRTSDAGARLADAESRLNTLYRSKMFPSQTNQLVAAQDVRRIQDWLASVTNRLHQGDVQVQAWLTPSSLKQAMIDLTKDQKIHPILGEKASIGFDAYLGADAAMPKEADVKGLGRQLEYVRHLLTLCAEAGVSSVEKVDRPKFETKGEVKQTAPSSRRRGRRVQEPEKKVSTGIDKVGDGLAERQRFKLSFRASTPALMEFFNRLTASPMMAVVSDFKVSRPSCILKDFLAESESKNPSAPAVDFSTLAPEDRLVSDPARVQPLRVDLTIDIYTFEGV